MKDSIMCVYLFLLSVQDIRSKQVSLAALLCGCMAGVWYEVCQKSGWGMVEDLLPGVVLCVCSCVFSGAFGIADGMAGMIYGLFFGWRRTCMLFLLAFMLVAVTGVLGMLAKKGRFHRKVAFFPFLTIVHIGMMI